MKKAIQWGASGLVAVLCMVAQLNISSASLVIGYQPRVPQGSLREEKND